MNNIMSSFSEDEIEKLIGKHKMKKLKKIFSSKRKKVLKEVLSKIYEREVKVILTKKEIVQIEALYKKEYKNVNSYDDLLKKCSLDIKKNLEKSKSAVAEIKKQLNINKALQPGILSECFFAQTLANLFQLNQFVDLELCKYNDVPVECIDYINSNQVTFNCGRYLYYNKNIKNMFLIQYGNPASGDAELVFNNIKIRIEFKEQKAKAGEYDIKYNEYGKLLITEEFKSKSNELIPLIQKFNSETNMLDYEGHNYRSFPSNMLICPAKKYFEKNNIDILISANNQNIMVAVTKDCIGQTINKKVLLDTSGSEIRTTGKNGVKIFTPSLFEKVWNSYSPIKELDGNYKIEKNKLGLKKGRGTDTFNRISFNKVFYIELKHVEENNTYYVINKDKIKQIKATVSVHITLEASFQDYKLFFIKKGLISEINS